MSQENPVPETNGTTLTGNDGYSNAAAALEKAYREALAKFKAETDITRKKELRRARTAAKRAWDEAVLKQCREKDDGAKALHCKDCSQMFLWTTEDQNYYQASERNWNHEPMRCRSCAESQKVRRINNNSTNNDDANKDGGEATAETIGKAGKNMCYAFQRGECRYGDRCKFNHDPNFAGKDRNEEEECENSRGDSENNQDKKTDDEATIIKKRKAVPDTIPICKWEMSCTMKKCRFRHVYEKSTTTTTIGSKVTNEKTAAITENDGFIKKKAKIPMGICKWGKHCRLKRCRLRHEDSLDNDTETSSSIKNSYDDAICYVTGSKAIVNPNSHAIIPIMKAPSTNDIAHAASQSTSKKEHQRASTNKKTKKDKTVFKAMRKALKKAPKKELRVKDLRKLIRSATDITGKDDLKIVVREAIANNKDSMMLLEDGKVVRLL
uniref:C3H1-type domain-containing protein n=1 Tax=Pseudo-nitzschia australis TaxID=44445 RepID=A0A7S4EKZ9_9STRA|mmetsp:Transcript_19976/g.42218  ORF Transcript_19976/g.42218 Transcript_19976/m.42218 type:complete len:438 (-) Transcript_19976:331-1644(-)